MRFKTSILSGKKLMDLMKNIQSDYEHQYKQHLTSAVMRVRNEAIRSIRNGTGSLFEIRYKPKRVVRVSNPGDAPNTDTGTLIKSIGWNINEDEMAGEVGTNLKYGKWLELGTQDMEPRPWLMPALERVKPDLIKIFRKGRGKRQVGNE